MLDAAGSEQTDHEQRYLQNHAQRYRETLDYLQQITATGKVLELGGYPYHLTTLLDDAGYDVTTIDAPDAPRNSVLDAYDGDVRYADIETEMLPVEDTYDIVLMAEIFEHLRINPLQTLRKVRDAVADDGVVVLTTPNLYSLYNIIDFLLGRGFDNAFEEFAKIEELGYMGHVREYRTGELRQFLDATGFNVTDVTYTNRGCYPGKQGKLMAVVERFKPELRKTQFITAEKKAEVIL